MSPSSSGTAAHTWYERVPLEVHGHRKKLDFVLGAVERLRQSRSAAPADVTIVEIGCSNGRILSLPLAERGYRVTGVDLHEASIARATADNNFPNARFICRNAESFMTVESFDVVILSDILEHVHDPLGLLTMAKGLLEPGGTVLICIPNGYGPAELERRFAERTRLDRALATVRSAINRATGRERVAYNDDSGHVQAFRMKDIEGLIELAGLRLEERRKGALFGGAVSYPVGSILPAVVRGSLRLADRLPFAWVSTWYFRCSARS
jgi:2-polyprenyl-3-methyl-5-hydroxy-6-metoxy-1,4-benzoquinol methylase